MKNYKIAKRSNFHGDLVMDIETLGTHPGCVILEIGADIWEGGTKPAETFHAGLDYQASLRAGFTVEPGTWKWWQDDPNRRLNLNSLLKPPLFDSNDCPRTDYFTDIKDGLLAFHDFVKGHDPLMNIWCKGPSFDAVILEAAYDRLNLPIPWAYWNLRDVRTAIELAGADPHVCEYGRDSRMLHTANADARAEGQFLVSCGAIPQNN